jgi:hypothetical protein
MTIPDVPEQTPGQSAIILPSVANPFLSIWWSTQTVSNVPENVMGWLVAQGYEVTGVTQDTTTVPPTNTFALTREGMRPLEVLLSLCNSYTTAANEARFANQLRYNEVLDNWTDMIDSSHDQFNAQTTEQNAQAGMFLTDLDDYMTAIETLIADNQTDLAADATEAKTALLAMDLRLSDLEDNAADSAVVIGDLLAEQEASLQAYITEYDTQLDALQQNVTDHIATVLAEVSSLGTVLEDHVADYAQQFDSLVANYNLHVADIDALLANVANNVSTYVADVATILTALDSDYTSVSTDLGTIRTSAGTLVTNHVTDYAALLALLSSDYTTQAAATRAIVAFLDSDYTPHVTTTRDIFTPLASDYVLHEGLARGFLDTLSETEIARITEEFAARLSSQLQMLVTRGLSTSTLIADITERNLRDRDEQIQLLNDRLMRQKFDNQHRLYEQQRSMRTAAIDNEHRLYEQKRAIRTMTVENEHRLYEQQLGMRTRTLDGKSQLHTVQQEVLRYQASLISGVYAMLQETRNRVLSGKQAIFSAKDATERLGIEVQTRLYAQLQDVRQRIIESSDRIYQLRDVYAKWSNTETHRTYEQLQQVQQLFVEAAERQHTAKQTVTRGEMSQRDILLQQLQTALTGLLSGKERFSTLAMQIANTLAEHKHKAIAQRLETAVKRLAGWQSIADENRKLMMYQLDERNKLLIGLYSFVERREDISPEWRDMSSMIAGLGDSGGGWIQP